MPRTEIPLYIILLTYVNQAHAHAPQAEAGEMMMAGQKDQLQNVWAMRIMLGNDEVELGGRLGQRRWADGWLMPRGC